jgi:hypothetical protein
MSRCPDASGIAHGRLRFVNTETFMMDKPGWASTTTIRTSATTTLADEEDHATPESPFDYDAFSRWSLVPST